MSRLQTGRHARPARGGGGLRALACVGLWIGGGCAGTAVQTPEPGTSPVASDDPPPSAADASQETRSIFERSAERLVIEFNVHRYSAPKGSFTESSELWKIASGAPSDAALAMHLADNGFRAGIGRASDRAALRGFLEGIEGLRSKLDQIMPDASRLLTLELGPCRPRTSVMYFDRHGGLHGADFVDAAASFQIAFELRSVDRRSVFLRVVPAIDEPPGPLRWIRKPTGIIQEAERRGRTFDNLAFGVEVPGDGFLLLAPTREVYRAPLLAEALLIEQEVDTPDGEPRYRENIYIISPIVRSVVDRRALERFNDVRPVADRATEREE